MISGKNYAEKIFKESIKFSILLSKKSKEHLEIEA